MIANRFYSSHKVVSLEKYIPPLMFLRFNQQTIVVPCLMIILHIARYVYKYYHITLAAHPARIISLE